MSKKKLVLITVIIIVCAGLVAIVYNSVFKEDSYLNKTYREVYEELTEEEKNMLKNEYREMQESNNLKDKLTTDAKVPDAVLDKFYPKEFKEPFEDFLKTK